MLVYCITIFSFSFYIFIVNLCALYSVGQEKVVHLPFCMCPCDILSDVNMYIA